MFSPAQACYLQQQTKLTFLNYTRWNSHLFIRLGKLLKLSEGTYCEMFAQNYVQPHLQTEDKRIQREISILSTY